MCWQIILRCNQRQYIQTRWIFPSKWNIDWRSQVITPNKCFLPPQVFLSIRSLGSTHEEAHLRRRRRQNGEVEEETEGREREREGEGWWEGAGNHSGRSLIPPRVASRRGTDQHGLNLHQVLRFGRPRLTMRMEIQRCTGGTTSSVT